jgi:hypothetical protein
MIAIALYSYKLEFQPLGDKFHESETAAEGASRNRGKGSADSGPRSRSSTIARFDSPTFGHAGLRSLLVKYDDEE